MRFNAQSRAVARCEAWWCFPQSLTLALAQQPQAPIRVQVNEVVVPVTVTDEKGRFVSDLEQNDFKLFDQGKEQTIRYFNRERNQRVVVGFLVDLSNQSRGQWKSLQEATIELVLNLLPGDKKYAGYLIGYGNEAELMVNTTSDPDPIVERLRKISPSGGSAFYDALYMACTSRKLVDGEPVDPRRVIVVVGDGHDNASTKTLDQVIGAGPALPGHHQRHQHRRLRLHQRFRQEPGASGRGNRRPRGIPADERLQGCFRIPVPALRRWKLPAQGGNRRVYGRHPGFDLQIDRQHRGRNHRAVRSSVRAQRSRTSRG